MNVFPRVALAAAIATLGACMSSEPASRSVGVATGESYDLEEAGDDAGVVTPADSRWLAPSDEETVTSTPGQPDRFRYTDGLVPRPAADTSGADELPARDLDGPPLASDPHTKRAGTDELPRHAAARAAYFVPSATEPRPVPRLRQPTLVSAARLAVVFVREGQIVGDSEALLSLEELLSKERGIRAVLALPPPNEAAVGLEGLAAHAKRLGRQLLLVDVISPDRGRVGYLLHSESGRLIARYAPKSGTPASGSGSGLLTRLGECYGRLVAK